MRLRSKPRNPAERLRFAVEALPRRTKEAMLRGIESNPIIVGAYVDRDSGGICPMLAAHRNGGRTSVASFARSWDRYTGARRPRLATKRELRTLRALLVSSLAREDTGDEVSLVALAAQIRAERAEIAARRPCATQPPAPPEAADAEPAIVPESEGAPIRIRRRRNTGERHRGAELRNRPRWAWLRPARDLDDFKDLLAAAEEQLSEQRAAELLPGPAQRHR